jgi:hypothetical protein
MKVAKALIVVGVIGIAVYVYAQLTWARSEFVWYTGNIVTVVPGYYSPPDVGLSGPFHVYVRDWTVGLAGAIIGAVLLGIGVRNLRRFRKAQGGLNNAGE